MTLKRSLTQEERRLAYRAQRLLRLSKIKAYSQLPEVVARRRVYDRERYRVNVAFRLGRIAKTRRARATEEGKAANRAQVRAWRLKYPDRRRRVARNWYSRRRSRDPAFRIQCNLRRRMTNALRQQRISCNAAIKIVGCAPAALRRHIESKFLPGMTWENYGPRGWNIDHVLPCASFDLSDPEQQRRCFHYTNLQPLWAVDNQKKGCKIISK